MGRGSVSADLLEAALSYAARGWPVFPLRPRSKLPATEHGLMDASTDPATIRAWWEKFPAANVGLRTGPASGLLIVDVDEVAGWTGLLDDAHAPSPNTARVQTGVGWHLYFASDEPVRNSAGKLAVGIDVRGDGGYVAAPPSVHENGHVYAFENGVVPEPLPRWLLERLTAKPAKAHVPDRTAPAIGDSPYGRAAQKAEAAIVAGAIEGTRNDRLNTAALKLGQLVAGGELDEHEARETLRQAALEAGLPEHEVEQTIKSGLSAGMAQPRRAPEKSSRRSPFGSDRDVSHGRRGVLDLRSIKPKARNPLLDEVHHGVTDSPAERLSLRNLDTYNIRRVEWLDKPFYQRSAFHVLAGRKGTCKGTHLCGIAARVTRGDLYDEPKRVLVITSEDSVELDFKPRVVAAGGDPSMVEIVVGPFRMPADLEWLKQKATDLGDVGLIVIDPIGNHLGGADTDKEGLVREGIGPLNAIADELDCMIVGVRHLGKDASRGALASVLGSTAWVDVPRAVILMAADDEDDRLFHAQVVAGNRGPKSSGRAFRLELVDVPPATEITLIVPEGESTKNVEDLLGAKGSGNAPESKSGKARELILDILEDEGEQESDAFDARIAHEIGITAKTVRNQRGNLKNDGLITARPEKDEQGLIVRWLVCRTHAPRDTA